MGEKPKAQRELKREFDRGMAVGIGLACSIIQSAHDKPSCIVEALHACGLDRRKLKAAGLDDYDLEILRPVFRELPEKRPRKRPAGRALLGEKK